MRPFLLIIFLVTLIAGHSQTPTLPTWFSDAIKSKGLDKKYDISSFLKPSFLQADFSGDATQDIAVLVIEKGTKRKGILRFMAGQENTFCLVQELHLAVATKISSGLTSGKFTQKRPLMRPNLTKKAVTY